MLSSDADVIGRGLRLRAWWPLWAGALSLVLHGGLVAWLAYQKQQQPIALSVDTVEVQIIALAPPAGEIAEPPPPAPEVLPKPEPEVVPEPIAPDEMAIKRKPKPPKKQEKPKPEPEKKPEPPKEPKPAAQPKVESNVKSNTSAPASANHPSKLPPAPEPVSTAQYNAGHLRNPPPPYPEMSRRLKEEGRVVLRVTVSSEGRPQAVSLHQSSGFDRLDQAAIKGVKRWRFVPAKRGEQPVESTVNVPVQFTLKNAR